VYTVVLAGGVGSRFWPASTPARPKQLLPLASDTPLIEETLARAVGLAGPRRLVVVTSAQLAAAFADLDDLSSASVLCEPEPRGTGPALVWAAHEIERREPGATMISMHADHRIVPFEGLETTLERAVECAGHGYLVCVGARPDRYETGYGYVHLGPPMGDGAHEVARFTEKPDLATAQTFVDSGEVLWNTGIFVWRCADFLAAAEEAPELAAALPRLRDGDVEGFFSSVRPIAVDRAIMERAARVATVEARFEWDDVGVWNALARARGVDSNGNAIVGRARLADARDNLVWCENSRANLIGVTGLLVVEANGEILVMPRECAGDLNLWRERLTDADPPGPTATRSSTGDRAGKETAG
jgi:mannose-1-phosphate guanylyltransferase